LKPANNRQDKLPKTAIFSCPSLFDGAGE